MKRDEFLGKRPEGLWMTVVAFRIGLERSVVLGYISTHFCQRHERRRFLLATTYSAFGDGIRHWEGRWIADRGHE